MVRVFFQEFLPNKHTINSFFFKKLVKKCKNQSQTTKKSIPSKTSKKLSICNTILIQNNSGNRLDVDVNSVK